jgi:hypothetical protein
MFLSQEARTDIGTQAAAGHNMFQVGLLQKSSVQIYVGTAVLEVHAGWQHSTGS